MLNEKNRHKVFSCNFCVITTKNSYFDFSKLKGTDVELIGANFVIEEIMQSVEY